MLNTKMLNEGLINGAAPEVVGPKHEFLAFRLEVHGQDGGLYAYLPMYADANWDRRINQVETLEFSYPAADSNSQYFVWPNQIWLRDERGTILQKFTIQKSTPERMGAVVSQLLYAESLLGLLNDDWVVEYSITNSTVWDILQDLFNVRITNSYSVRLGYVSRSIKETVTSLNVSAGSLLGAVRQLFDSVGIGYMYVDPKTRCLNWKVSIGENKGQQLRYRKNLNGIKVVYDWSDFVNRLYLYGDGPTKATRLTLLDAGQAHEYIQDTSYTSRIRSRVMVAKNITQADALLSTAQSILDVLAQPYIGYELSVLDLSQSKDRDCSFERLLLGSSVTVIDEVLGVDSKETVVRMSHRLNNPADITVELAQQSRDVSALLNGLEQRVDVLENADLGVPLGSATPEPVGTGAVGTSARGSHEDHSHAIDPAAIADIINNDTGVQDALQDAVAAWVPTPGDPVLPIGEGNDSGADNDHFARRDHVHEGHNFTAADVASLPSKADGCIGATTGGEKPVYIRTDSTWMCLTQVE